MSWKSIFFKAAWLVLGEVIQHLPGSLKKIKEWWTGKTIAIIGPTASGKNSMYSRLQKKPIPAEHIQTRGAEKVRTFKVKWPLPNGENVDFHCKRSLNIGGEADERERYWLQACEGADVVFYLLDSEKLREAQSATLQRFHEDMRWLITNFRHFKSNVTVHMLLNKVDVALGPPPYGVPAMREMTELLDKMEKEAKLSLERYFERVTGVTPISMADEHLFNKYFANALSAIAELR